jgi:hypothetical protein
MMRLLTHLSDAQRAAMPSHARDWIEVGWRTGEADWATFTDALRRCYRYTGVPWPGRVVRVPSPAVGALAAPLAAYALSESGPHQVPRSISGGVRESVQWRLHTSARDLRTEIERGVHDPVEGAVDRPVNGALTGAVIGVLDRALMEGTAGALTGAVRDAVREATGDRPAPAWSQLPKPVRALWSCHEGGQHSLSTTATLSYFRDTAVEIDGPRDRDRAWCAAQAAAGWYWVFRDFVMVADRPRVLHLEQAGPAGTRSHRLHCATGPALAWPDGWALYYWHGTPVPADLVERGWDIPRILGEANVEVRRCAVERLGWDRFVVDAGLRPTGPAVPDPGNPDQTLTLYDVPERFLDRPARVLLCTNGTPERDGTRRRYGLVVPTHLSDPVAAAAWTYDWPENTYRQLARRA